MSRTPVMPLISDADANEDLRQIYEMCRHAMGGVPHLARVIANSPELLGPFLGLAGAVAMEYTVPIRLKQLAVIRTSELNGCLYCRSIHRPKSLGAGIDEAKLDAVQTQELPTDLFDEDEQLVLRMADEMTGAVGATPDTMRRARERFGEAGTVELLMTISFYNLMNRLAESTQVPLEG